MKIAIRNLSLILLLIQSFSVFSISVNVSREQAVGIAQTFQAGRVLSIKQKGQVYRVKMLLETGEVKVVVIDVQSGKIKSRD